jgi:hypothetical protein
MPKKKQDQQNDQQNDQQTSFLPGESGAGKKTSPSKPKTETGKKTASSKPKTETGKKTASPKPKTGTGKKTASPKPKTGTDKEPPSIIKAEIPGVDKLSAAIDTRLLLPVSQENLAQYMTTGIIGLTSVNDPVPDLQCYSWPSNLIFRGEIPSTALAACGENPCVVVLSPNYLGGILSEGTQIPTVGPCSMRDVDLIFFRSEEDKNEFFTAYDYLEDVPVGYYKLAVDETLFNLNSDISPPFKVPEQKEDSRLPFKIAAVNFYSAYKEIALSEELVDNFLDNRIEISQQNIKELIEKLILDLSSRGKRKELPLDSFDVVSAKALASILGGKEIGPSVVPNMFFKLFEDASDDVPDQVDKNQVKDTIDKYRGVLNGEIELPRFQDIEGNILKRSIYLVGVSRSISELEETGIRLKAGPIISCLSRFLFWLKAGYISLSSWRDSHENYLQLHEVSNTLFNDSTVSIVREQAQVDENLVATTAFLINDKPAFTRRVHGSPVLTSLRGKIRKLGKNTNVIQGDGRIGLSISELGGVGEEHKDIKIDFYVHDHVLTKRQVILITSDVSYSRLPQNAQARLDVSSLSRDALVAVYQIENGIRVSAYQLDETLDQDELEDKINLVVAVCRKIVG